MLRPLRNNIIVRRVPNPEDHWLIPEAFREKSLRAEVVATGPNATDTSVGDVVIFGHNASLRPYAAMGAEFVDSDAELLVLSEMDVLGVVSG